MAGLLRGVDFGSVRIASGTQGFFGEGYDYQKLLYPLNWGFPFTTFVAKTTTYRPRLRPDQKEGNMPLREDKIRPKEFKPETIWVDIAKGIALNAVGLSNGGAAFLLNADTWQKRRKPFFLSFMSVQSNADARLMELRFFTLLFQHYLRYFYAPVGLEWNVSCPNVGIDPQELIDEVEEGLEILSVLDIPILVKFNVLTPVEVAEKVSRHPACDGFCISNTIPWGKLPERINWKELFGSEVSPLAQFGGGGLSGRPLLPLVREWILNLREAGVTKSIHAGGGILSPRGVKVLGDAGADSVFLGSISFLRPHNILPTIIYGHHYFGRRKRRQWESRR